MLLMWANTFAPTDNMLEDACDVNHDHDIFIQYSVIILTVLIFIWGQVGLFHENIVVAIMEH